MLVENQVIVELKAIERIEPIHDAQLLSYLKLSGSPVGLLINFNVTQLKRGIRRLVNNFNGPMIQKKVKLQQPFEKLTKTEFRENL